jgi:hypothetical protein
MGDTQTGKEGGDDTKEGSRQPTAIDTKDEDGNPNHGRERATTTHGKGTVVASTVTVLSKDVVRNTKEDTKEDGAMVALRNVKGAFLANHETENENDGSNGDSRDDTENGGNDTNHTEDKVDPSVNHGVSCVVIRMMC